MKLMNVLTMTIGVALKVDVPNLNTTVIWTPVFEWYMVKCGSKNWPQKDVFQN